MSKKNEQSFLTIMSRLFRERNWFYYKIPDTLGMAFTPAKPFDCFISIDGHLGGVEAKYCDMDPSKTRAGKPKKGASSIGLDNLRDNQHAALAEVSERGGVAMVWYEVKLDGEYRLYFWSYDYFKALCKRHGPKGTTIPRHVLKDLIHDKRITDHVGRHAYDLTRLAKDWDALVMAAIC